VQLAGSPGWAINFPIADGILPSQAAPVKSLNTDRL
jgi:hypothetical protein